MIGRIVGVKDSKIYVQLGVNIYTIDNLIGKYLIFSDRYIGEVNSIVNNTLEVSIVGEIFNNEFISGNLGIPSFNSSCRLITKQELDIIYGNLNYDDGINIGKSYFYSDYDVLVNRDKFFSNHFAILGNSGCGKSYFVTKLIQELFYSKKVPIKSNIFLFDAYGEYQSAFHSINSYNSNLNYKVITTNLNDANNNRLLIPFWLLSVDDICLLLGVDDNRQINIIEKALKLVSFFTNSGEDIDKQKNDIIARTILDIIFSVSNHSEVRNKIISVLTQFNTFDLNLDLQLAKGGWVRTIRQCLSINEEGNFADIEVIINYLETLCCDNFELTFPDGKFMYSLKDFYNALEFALLSEGIFSSNKVFDYANMLKVRLNSLINSDYARYFDCDRYINKNEYINYLIYNSQGMKCQLINFNINYVDDRFAKVIVKIFSKLLFDYAMSLPNRASMPIHIILEEAHRYVQDDMDNKILGYNIFERINKEGRKYGVLLGVISQRPTELSATVISQCSNFAVFKMFYKKDLDMVTDAISINSFTAADKIKNLVPGSCILFGNAFRIPVVTKVGLPNPAPSSDSCNISNIWYN